MIDQLNLFEHWNFNSRSLPGERFYFDRKLYFVSHFNSLPLRGE